MSAKMFQVIIIVYVFFSLLGKVIQLWLRPNYFLIQGLIGMYKKLFITATLQRYFFCIFLHIFFSNYECKKYQLKYFFFFCIFIFTYICICICIIKLFFNNHLIYLTFCEIIQLTRSKWKNFFNILLRSYLNFGAIAETIFQIII